MNLDAFLRVHALRAPKIMWLLGAGASAGAGIPSAFHMIWDFKRLLFSAREKVSLRALGDITDQVVRRRVQQYFDRTGAFPPENAPEEYAVYFEAAYPNEADRQRYIQARVEGASPSFGHYALAALMKADRLRAAWTTNFDRLVEDAAAQVFATTGRLMVAALGEPELASQAIAEGRWPFLGKLHGDFQSRRIKNISMEIREQDGRMRDALRDSFRSFGLAVVGYSGRDHSVMDALEEVLNEDQAYPFGLFWFHRDDTPPLPRVLHLIDRASERGVETALIPIETFDELMADLLLLETELPSELAALLREKRTTRITNVALPDQAGGWPVLRFNALPVVDWPTTCRIVRCDIGGTAQVRQVIAEAHADVLAVRRRAGVICFGSNEEVRRVFSPFGISDFGLYPIEPKRLQYWDSAELGLLYEALGRAFGRDLPLMFILGRSTHRLVVNPACSRPGELVPLSEVVGELAGTVSKSGVHWSEALTFRLEYRLGRLWLLLEPTVWLHSEPGAPRDESGVELIRQRLAARYNQVANRLLDAWKAVILRGKGEQTVQSLGIADGVDASFTISSVTAYSRRMLR